MGTLGDRCGRGLRALGLQAGDTVAALLPNGAAALALYFAAIETGLYVVPVNWHQVAAEVAYILGDSGAGALVAHERFAGTAVEAADLAGMPERIHDTLENADLHFATVKDEDGEDVQLAQGNWQHLVSSDNRPARRAAWQAYADGYVSMANTMAGTLEGGVKRDVFYARAHHYDSAREAAMNPHNIQLPKFIAAPRRVRSLPSAAAWYEALLVRAPATTMLC